MDIAEVLTGHVPGSPWLRRPYLIAEAGVNHEGSMDIARRLIAEAADSGADAIKFQSYRAETIASRDSPAYWDLTKEPTTSQFELFSRHDSFWKSEFEVLARASEDAGITFLSTPFDVESAGFLADLQPVFKIASADLTNLPFVDVICSFGKPVLLSTGASDPWEITETVDRIRRHGNALGLMHCILNYPTAHEDANLGMIVDLRRRFPDHAIGYSDHTVPDPEMSVVTTAALLGAVVIEKHFTHDKTLPGNDHYHAMDRTDVVRLNERLDRLFSLVGEQHKSALPSETPARLHARRSLVAARSIEAGAVIVPEDLTWKRPAHGISPRQFEDVLGRRARVAIEEDTVLRWAMLD